MYNLLHIALPGGEESTGRSPPPGRRREKTREPRKQSSADRGKLDSVCRMSLTAAGYPVPPPEERKGCSQDSERMGNLLGRAVSALPGRTCIHNKKRRMGI